MLSRVDLPGLSIVGVSVGGVYTSILVPELSAIFDVGIAPRSFVGARYLFLSHGHADHVGALPSLIGVRGLSKVDAPVTFMPAEIADDLTEGIARFNRGQRRAIDLLTVPMAPGQIEHLYADLYVRAIRTLHSVPSLAYVLFRRVEKLKPEFLKLDGREIARRRAASEDLFEIVERPELAYVTDTLIDVLDNEPELYQSRVLILECTFLDEAKTVAESRDKCHVHLDEIIERADCFENEYIVLMHFSQSYQPSQVGRILERRLPPELKGRVKSLRPSSGPWPG